MALDHAIGSGTGEKYFNSPPESPKRPFRVLAMVFAESLRLGRSRLWYLTTHLGEVGRVPHALVVMGVRGRHKVIIYLVP